MYTDESVKRAVEQAAGISIREEHWLMALQITLDDAYANYICFGKDVPYTYFINTAARSLQLVARKVQEVMI